MSGRLYGRMGAAEDADEMDLVESVRLDTTTSSARHWEAALGHTLSSPSEGVIATGHSPLDPGRRVRRWDGDHFDTPGAGAMAHSSRLNEEDISIEETPTGI